MKTLYLVNALLLFAIYAVAFSGFPWSLLISGAGVALFHKWRSP